MRKMKEQNQAFMMKLGWKLINRRDDLWVNVIRTKYKCGNDLKPRIDEGRTGSNTWLGIRNNWKKVKENIVVDVPNQSVKWRPIKTEEFSVKSAYGVLINEQRDDDRIWQRIWKLDTLQRCRTFMWLVAQNKILTNAERTKRKMSTDSSCSWCQENSEDVIHVLRDCNETKKVWQYLIPRNMQQHFFNMNSTQWLRTNIFNFGS